MSLYFCTQCKTAFLPEQTITDGSSLFCKKCQKSLTNLGSEDGRVSLRGHLESQKPVNNNDLYHDYSLIRSKHYQVPKHDPILMDVETKLKVDPLNTDALYTLSQWYYSQGMLDEAIAIANQIIKIKPNFLKAHEFISRHKTKRIINQDDAPEDIQTLEEMAINFYNSKQYQKAEIVLKKILSFDSKHAAARRYLAEIYTATNQVQEAIHQLNRLAMQYPEDDRVLFNLAVACYNANDFSRAQSNLKAALKVCRDSKFKSEIEQFLNHLESNNMD